jgi:curved DNA-binding protein CbpA
MPTSPSSRSAYDILGVPPTASQDDIKKKYRELARKYHPDANQNNPSAAAIFGQISTAYKTLSDPMTRAEHDAELAEQQRRKEFAARQQAARQQGTRAATGAGSPGTVGQRGYAPPKSPCATTTETPSPMKSSAMYSAYRARPSRR